MPLKNTSFLVRTDMLILTEKEDFLLVLHCKCEIYKNMFCGQLFCGMLLDVFGGGTLNKREFGAGILVAAGIAVSQVSKICRDRKEISEVR